MKIKLFIFFIIILSIFSISYSNEIEGHLKLLAIQENGDKTTGDVADLYLILKPGSGRVFLNTEPLTKFDTQITTRFAKDLACKYSQINCELYDFYYTIKSDSPIIGGSSAGAAVTLLTYILLSGYDYKKNIAITGTINSGGVIGPVGGLKEKIDAAAKNKINTILIPSGESVYKKDNETTSLIEYGKNLGINVYEVRDIFDALYYFSDIKIKRPRGKIIVPQDYQRIMSNISSILCRRNDILFNEVINLTTKLFNLSKDTIYNDIINNKSSVSNKDYNKLIDSLKRIYDRRNNSKTEYEKEFYYSSASLCYTNNVRLRDILLKFNISLIDFDTIEKQIKDKKGSIKDREITTLTELEVYAIINQRLNEAEQYLKRAKNSNDTEEMTYFSANAIERLFSTESWDLLFSMVGTEYDINQKSLKESCLNKINEAKERYYYLSYIMGSLLIKQITPIKEDIGKAYSYYLDKEYVLCLFQAANAKAELDVMLDSLTVNEENIDIYIESKQEIVKENILYQINKENFPISGYSYYQYALSLKNSSSYSALAYLNYALELSNLDMYFNQKKYNITLNSITSKDDIQGDKKLVDVEMLIAFFIVLIIGFLLGYLTKDLTKKRYKK